MPRRARELSQSGIYHIMLRGINRQGIFEDDEDRKKLLEKLAQYKETCGYRLFAYCLMDNHIHLLMQEQKEPLSTVIKRLSSSYVFWFNAKYERCGHLFQERFKSEVVDNERYFLSVIRYIHQNPVKVKIAEDMSSYKWSSYGEYFGAGKIVDKDYVLNMFTGSDGEALRRFDEFQREKNEDDCLDVEEIRLMSDERLNETIKKQFGIEAIRIANQEKGKQTPILKKLKGIEGVSIRQIARVTGVSQSQVWRA